MEKLFENQYTLGLFLLFFVPGFVSLKTYDLLVPGERRDLSKSLYDAVAYGALNLGVLFWAFDLILGATMPRFWWYLCWFIALVLCPVLWPIIAIKARQWRWIRRFVHDPQPRVWDCVFRKRDCYWIIAHLKDRRIGGAFATASFASSAPSPTELFLEEVWNLDAEGRFVSRVESTAGVFIPGDQIVAIEFFRYYSEHEPREREHLLATGCSGDGDPGNLPATAGLHEILHAHTNAGVFRGKS